MIKAHSFSKIGVALLVSAMLLSTAACGSSGNNTASVSDNSTTISESASKTETLVSETIVAERTVLTEDLHGTVTATSDAGTMNLVQGDKLVSGQDVATEDASDLTLLLDTDKHVYAEEKTRFNLEATGVPGSTKTLLKLTEGTLRSVIDNKLGPEETYEVTTPNAAMAVRGTDFTVTVKNVNGDCITTVKVDSGIVNVQTVAGGEETSIDAEPGQSFSITKEGLKELKEENKSRLTKETVTTYDNGAAGYMCYYLYSYDDNGYLIKKEFTNTNDYAYRYEYENDVNGNPVKETLADATGVSYYTTYEYNARGLKTHDVVIDPNGGSDDVIQEHAFEYDGNGNLIDEKCLIDEWDYITYWYSYEYDENGNKTAQIMHNSLEDPGVSQRNEWDYDDQGRVIKYTENAYWDGQTFIYEERNGYKYDENGNLAEYTQSYSGTPHTVYSMIYDEKGNLIKQTESSAANGQVMAVTEYEYADDGE